MLVLQLISLFIFIVLVVGVFNILKDVIENSKEGFAFNLGYFLGGIIIIGLLFWLNIQLYKFTSRK